MRQEKGLTIVQLMLILAAAGIAGWLVVGVLIEKRCEQFPGSVACAHKQAS